MQNILDLLETNNFNVSIQDNSIYSTSSRSLLEDSISFQINTLSDGKLYVTKIYHLKHDDNLFLGNTLCHIEDAILEPQDLIQFLNSDFKKDGFFIDQFNYHLTY
jgi:hypothetical protein